jgi:hypothetical protein
MLYNSKDLRIQSKKNAKATRRLFKGLAETHLAVIGKIPNKKISVALEPRINRVRFTAYP